MVGHTGEVPDIIEFRLGLGFRLFRELGLGLGLAGWVSEPVSISTGYEPLGSEWLASASK